MRHRRRPTYFPSEPVRVTMRLARDLRSPRRSRVRTIIERTLDDVDGPSFHVVGQAVKPGHLHVIVSARDRDTLLGGIKSVAVTVARRVNQVLGRRGRVFHGRYSLGAVSCSCARTAELLEGQGC
jgi:hypothetical protein